MTTHSSRSGSSFDQPLLTFRIIAASLGLGVTAFSLVTWFTHAQAPPAAPALDPAVMFNIMVLVAVGSLGAAIIWWRNRVAPLLEQSDPADPMGRFGEIQTNVIITWALAEAPAIFAQVVYFLYGNVLAGALGLVIIWSALAFTWPRRSWFEAR